MPPLEYLAEPLEGSSGETLLSGIAGNSSSSTFSNELRRRPKSPLSHNVEEKLDKGFNSKPQSDRGCLSRCKSIWGLCFTLHVLLVGMHVALIGVWACELEHRTVVPIGSQTNLLSVGLTVLSQTFVIVYLAGMVWTTQQLYLKRNLSLRQTLTAAHDKSTAFTGLGAALLSLWRQKIVTSSVWSVAAVTLYLSSISALHVTTPALFSVSPFNASILTPVSTSLGSPYHVLQLANHTLLTEQIDGAAGALPIVNSFDEFSTLGLNGSTLYDVLSENQGAGSIEVNATSVVVSCGAIPGILEARGSSGGLLWVVAGDVEGKPLQWENGNPNITSGSVIDTTVPQIGKYLDVVLPDLLSFTASGNATMGFTGTPTIISSINFTDSQGSTGSVASCNPPIKRPLADASVNSVYALQVMSCDITLNNHTTHVDPHTRMIIDTYEKKNSSTWTTWEPKSSPGLDANITVAWKEVLGGSATTQVLNTLDDCTGTSNPCGYARLWEKFVMDELGFAPYTSTFTGAAPAPRPQLKLHELENALANMAATVFWAAAHTKPSTGDDFRTMNGLAPILQPFLQSRLQLNIIPLAFGLGSSIVLLALAVLLIGKSDGAGSAIDTVGILQILWLSSRTPAVQNHISTVTDPSGLREAGMFEVCMAGENGSSPEIFLPSRSSVDASFA